MKKIISLVIGAIMLISVDGIGTAFTSEIPTFDENSVISNSVENVQEDEIVVDKSDSSEEQEEVISSSDTEKSEEKKSNESTKTEEPKKVEEKKIEQTPEKVVESNKQVEENSITTQPVIETQKQNNIQKNEVETQKENVKKDTPWDSLGITEYEYYHTPAHSWAELDFKISDYGSREATLNACKEYGNKYIAENSGGYFCDSVNSYSGDYLGEDIDFY